MTVRTELENRIAREQQKVAELRNTIEHTEAFIQGLMEALKILPKDVPNIQRSRRGPLRSRSDVQRARQLLGTVKGPLHVSDILNGIGKEDTKQNRASLGSSLARYARKGEIFRREGPNEFSLIVTDPTDETHEVQLPPSFGTDM